MYMRDYRINQNVYKGNVSCAGSLITRLFLTIRFFLGSGVTLRWAEEGVNNIHEWIIHCRLNLWSLLFSSNKRRRKNLTKDCTRLTRENVGEMLLKSSRMGKFKSSKVLCFSHNFFFIINCYVFSSCLKTLTKHLKMFIQRKSVSINLKGYFHVTSTFLRKKLDFLYCPRFLQIHIV